MLKTDKVVLFLNRYVDSIENLYKNKAYSKGKFLLI